MTLKPCATCGEPTTSTRCTDCATQHETARKPSARARGYDTSWDRLSAKARRLQPWCLHCGATQDLQADHTPEAWKRQAAGKTIRLQDVRVLCGPCNRAAGAARSNTPRGYTPKSPGQDSAASPKAQ